MIAPVDGSGSWPAWMQMVEKRAWSGSFTRSTVSNPKFSSSQAPEFQRSRLPNLPPFRRSHDRRAGIDSLAADRGLDSRGWEPHRFRTLKLEKILGFHNLRT